MFYTCVVINIPGILVTKYRVQVASFTDAWIETGLIRIELLGGTVASFTDAWIETAYPFRAYEAI